MRMLLLATIATSWLLAACSAPSTPASTPTPDLRTDVVRFVKDLKRIEADTEKWGQDFQAFLRVLPSLRRDAVLPEFDKVNAQYTAIANRLQNVSRPTDADARQAHDKWVTTFSKLNQVLLLIREAAASGRPVDAVRLKALQDETTLVDKQADEALADLMKKYKITDKEVAP